MRLVDNHHPPVVHLLGRLEGGHDFSGMVGVVVNHHDAVDLPDDLKAPLDAAEIEQAVSDGGKRHLQFAAGSHRRQGVGNVVLSRHVQNNFTQKIVVMVDRKGRAARLQTDPCRTIVSVGGKAEGYIVAGYSWSQRRQTLVVGRNNHRAVKRHAVHVGQKRIDQVVHVGIAVQVVAFKVGYHRHGGKHRQEGAVIFIGFRYQVIAFSQSGAGAQFSYDAPDDKRRLVVAVLKDLADH